MTRCSARVGAVIVLGVLAGACGGGDRSGETVVRVEEQPAAAALPTEPASAGIDEGAAAVPVVSDGLLSVVIPPCTPLDGVEHDPCSPDIPPSVRPGSIEGHSIPSYVTDPPSFADIMSGVQAPGFSPHIVVRATVEPGTTRCDGYLLDMFDHFGGRSSESRLYWCFADVRVNEYLVGAGPPTLTIGFHRETFSEGPGHSWALDRDFVIEHEFKNPAERTAAAYEGRELVVFLNPTMTKTVESWAVGGHWDTWFVRRDPDTDPPTVTAAFRWGHQVVSEATLDDLVASVKAAAAARTVAGQTSTARSTIESTAPPISTFDGWATAAPYLVARGDQLRDYYITGGAVYEGEDATTVLPPPAPVPPGVPTNIGLSTDGDRHFLTWDEPASGGDVDLYYVWLKSVISENFIRSFYDSPSRRAEFEISGMIFDFSDEFTVRVRAENMYGTSDWSPIQTFETPG